MNYILQHNLTERLGTAVREEDWIFYRPDHAQSPDDREEELEEEDEEAFEMTLVKHLCSTTVDPTSGLPTQNLTVMCGDTGETYLSVINFLFESVNIICNKSHSPLFYLFISHNQKHFMILELT
jgi:hypothetical protein